MYEPHGTGLLGNLKPPWNDSRMSLGGTIEEAKKLLVKLNKEATKAEAGYDEAVETFEKEWGSRAED